MCCSRSFCSTPVLNPWYLVWLAPFVALAPTRRAVALLAVVPLSYATGLNLGDPTLATYGQPNWVRPIEFGILFPRNPQHAFGQYNERPAKPPYFPRTIFGGGSALAHDGDFCDKFSEAHPDVVFERVHLAIGEPLRQLIRFHFLPLGAGSALCKVARRCNFSATFAAVSFGLPNL